MRTRAVLPVLALLLLLPALAFAECDPGGRCCDDDVCCSDGRDNDGDGFTDCDDPDCAGLGGCPGGGETDCTNGIDDDMDGFVDCADDDCFDDPACGESDCTNGLDDDGDGETDCADRDCADDPACPETDCANGEDDDNDGRTDCDDDDCAGSPDCATETDCGNGLDDDSDGLVDCDDRRDCADAPNCLESDCNDGVDDDGDGLVDCADVDCMATGCCPSLERCDDLRDNDLDGLIDCEDVDQCIDADVCALPPEICDDGRDDDRDGLIDCDDPQCVRFPDCPAPPDTPPPPVLIAHGDLVLGCLWPPNHRMVCVDSGDLAFDVTGGCGDVRLVLEGCSSNQPEDDHGDGHFEPDCVVTRDSVCLRAERLADAHAERVYTVTGFVVDSSGRVSSVEVLGTVRVPRASRAAMRCEDPLGPHPARSSRRTR